MIRIRELDIFGLARRGPRERWFENCLRRNEAIDVRKKNKSLLFRGAREELIDPTYMFTYIIRLDESFLVWCE